MAAKTREIGTTALVGSLVGGLIGAGLTLGDVPFSWVVGAILGGAIGGWLLYGKLSHAAVSGALSGILSTFVLLGVSDILFIFDLTPPPSGPTPPLSQLQALVVFIVLSNTIAGAAGGAVGGAIHRPTQAKEIPPPPPPSAGQGTGTAQAKYCVQCGAQLPSGAAICPSCNARQP